MSARAKGSQVPGDDDERIAELAQIYSGIAWREAAKHDRPRDEVMDSFVAAAGWQPSWFDEARAVLEARESASGSPPEEIRS